MMSHVFGRYGISITIFTAVIVGIGSGYLLQRLNHDWQADSREQLPAPLDAAASTENFVVGPGHLDPPLHAQHTEVKAKILFKLDQHGDLVVNQSTETALDSLLVLLPAEPTAADLHTIETAARAGLPDGAADKAVKLLREYIAYRDTISALPGQPEPDDPVEQRDAYANKIAHLRSRHFEVATSEALFGVREAQRIYSSEILRIASNNALSPAEKEQQIMMLHQSLPPKVAALEFNGSEFSAELEQQVAMIRLRHGSDEDVQNLRRQYFGIETPTRDGTVAELQ
jgi:lipase chaperone LimK